MNVIASFLIFCIKAIRPLLLGPAVCYFDPSCSVFACEQLETKPLATALILIIKRLISCNPFTL